MANHPPPRLRVDVATGATHLDCVDFVLPGTMPLMLVRHYRSNGLFEGCLGPRWRFGFEMELLVTDDSVRCDGGPFDGVAFAPVAEGRAALQEASGLVLENLSDAYVLQRSNHRQYVFLKRHAVGNRYVLGAVRDERGGVLHLDRDQARIAEIRDPLGRMLTFSYRGDLVYEVKLSSPGSGQPIALARYGYDGGHLQSAKALDGPAAGYDVNGGLMTTFLSCGGRKTYAQYAEDERCLALWGDDGTACRFGYDDARQTTRAIDASGGQTLFRHAGRRHVLERIDHDGASFSFLYDEADRLVGHGSAAGVHVYQRFDPEERRLTGLSSERIAAFVTYDESGQARSAEDAYENASTMHWEDGVGLSSIQVPGEGTFAFERDEQGRITTVVSATGRAAKLEWTPNQLTVADAEGTRWRSTIDSLGRVTERVDRTGRREARSYRTNGQLSEVKFEDGPAVEFLYDPDGRLVSTLRSDGSTLRIARDAGGRPTGEESKPGRSVMLERDASDRIVTARYGSNSTVALDYGPDGRLSRLSGGLERTYSYDDGETNVRDDHSARLYDFAGDLIEWVGADGGLQRFAYGPCGEILEWERGHGEDTLARIVPQYDGCGRLTGLFGFLPDRKTRSFADVNVSFQNDLDGLLTAICVDGDEVIKLDLDSLGRPAAVSGSVSPIQLTFDGADRLTAVDADGESIDIEYDVWDSPMVVRHGERMLDLRSASSVVWDETIASGNAAEARCTLSLRVATEGCVLFVHLGPLAIPVWVGAEFMGPRVSAATYQVAAAIRGPGAAFAAPVRGLEAVGRWLVGPVRDLHWDATAVPASNDLGLPFGALDSFYLDGRYLHADLGDLGSAARHIVDPARGLIDALTGAQCRGPLRPAPWRERAVSALFPAVDLLAPHGAPTESDVLRFLGRRGG